MPGTQQHVRHGVISQNYWCYVRFYCAVKLDQLQPFIISSSTPQREKMFSVISYPVVQSQVLTPTPPSGILNVYSETYKQNQLFANNQALYISLAIEEV